MQYKVWNKKNVENAQDGDMFFRLNQRDNDVVLNVVGLDGKVINGKAAILLIDSDYKTIITSNSGVRFTNLKSDHLDYPLVIRDTDMSNDIYKQNKAMGGAIAMMFGR